MSKSSAGVKSGLFPAFFGIPHLEKAEIGAGPKWLGPIVVLAVGMQVLAGQSSAALEALAARCCGDGTVGNGPSLGRPVIFAER
jgi:hypothetical protein